MPEAVSWEAASREARERAQGLPGGACATAARRPGPPRTLRSLQRWGGRWGGRRGRPGLLRAGAGAVLREASGCLPSVLATSGRAPSGADLVSAGECGSRSPGVGGSVAVRVVPETRSFSAPLLSALCLPFLYSGPRCALSFGLQPPLTPASAVLARIWVPPAPSSPPRWDHVYPIRPLLPEPRLPACLSVVAFCSALAALLPSPCPVSPNPSSLGTYRRSSGWCHHHVSSHRI